MPEDEIAELVQEALPAHAARASSSTWTCSSRSTSRPPATATSAARPGKNGSSPGRRPTRPRRSPRPRGSRHARPGEPVAVRFEPRSIERHEARPDLTGIRLLRIRVARTWRESELSKHHRRQPQQGEEPAAVGDRRREDRRRLGRVEAEPLHDERDADAARRRRASWLMISARQTTSAEHARPWSA